MLGGKNNWYPRGQRNHEANNVNTGSRSKDYCVRHGLCDTAQNLGGEVRKATPQRRSIRRIPKNLVDASRKGDAGDGLHVQNGPETIKGTNTIRRGAAAIPMAAATQGEQHDEVSAQTPADSSWHSINDTTKMSTYSAPREDGSWSSAILTPQTRATQNLK